MVYHSSIITFLATVKLEFSKRACIFRRPGGNQSEGEAEYVQPAPSFGILLSVLLSALYCGAFEAINNPNHIY